MKVYVAMINDRHADPEPEVFSTAVVAIAYAEGWATGAAYRPEDFQVTLPPPDGWLYHASYSPESDSVWVLAKTINGVDE